MLGRHGAAIRQSVVCFQRMAHNVARRPTPLAPTPRVFPKQQQEQELSKKLQQWWRNGTLQIRFGWCLLGLVGVDRYLQYRQSLDRQQMITSVQHDLEAQKLALLEAHVHDPTLFVGTVVHEYKDLSGSHGLTNIARGDLLDILQERVGPQQDYYLCRIQNNNNNNKVQVGWFPMAYVKKQRGWLRRKLGW